MHPILTQNKLQPQNPGACFDHADWSETNTNGAITSIDPTTGEPLAQVFNANDQDRERVTQSACDAFLQWRAVPAPVRGQLIRACADAFRAEKEALGSLISLEMGKSLEEGLGEVQEMIDMADFVVGQSRMLYGKTMHSERPLHRMYEQWHPLGVVGVITAFNFPMAVWAWNALLAAACGNTIIWKPSSKTPLCALAVQKICNEVMLAQGYTGIFNLLISNDAVVKQNFVRDSRVQLVSFTGSSAAGQVVATEVAGRFGKSLLELSGNNAIILAEDADMNLALHAIIFGAVGTAGQRCTSTRRLLVPDALYDVVADTLVDAYAKLKVGNPLDRHNHMGPLIDHNAVQQFERALAMLPASGQVLYGGRRLEGAGFFVEPTLVAAENHWQVVQEETFAPILYLIRYDNFDHAIALQNQVPQGLSSALFTRSVAKAEQFLSAFGSDCGIANVNIGTSGAEIGGAFGGEKATGGGREAGSDAWKSYMRRQTNTINWSSQMPLAQGIQFDLS